MPDSASSVFAQYQIIRRNGAVVPFEPGKIAVALMKAFLAVHGTQGAASASVRETVDALTQNVVRALMRSRPGGVTFPIYFVTAWRAGEADLLASPIGRGMLYSALTTGAAFGSLAISTHTGTASMGMLLTLALSYTLAATLIFLPALLGPPPQKT
jgi:hypothetical protein